MQNMRELSTFPLAPHHQSKLYSAGYLVADNLKNVKPSELSKDLEISHEAALDILRTVLSPAASCVSTTVSSSVNSTVSALDLLQDERRLQSIVTFSERLDTILGGGIPLYKITEFCGAPGVGKTQICMQLAVDVQIPKCFGGLDGEAVYVDTEGSFIVERLADIAQAAADHCRNTRRMTPEQKSAASSFTTDKILSQIYYFRCCDYVELLAIIHLFPDFLSQHHKVKLIIIDSIAFHFRHDFEDLGLRTRLLTTMAQQLIQLANNFGLAVVLTNQMTTRFTGGSTSHLVPALGESWAHISTVRVILFWENRQRKALLYKSPCQKEAVVPYQITMGGIRDIVTEISPSKLAQGESQPTQSDTPVSKRQKTT